jgi:hypothetical protein
MEVNLDVQEEITWFFIFRILLQLGLRGRQVRFVWLGSLLIAGDSHYFAGL